MLTVKYNNGSFERIVSGVKDVIWRDGSLTCLLADGGDYIFGPFHNDSGCLVPVAYVMNERGSTIASYQFNPPMLGMPYVDGSPYMQAHADLSSVAAAGQVATA